MIFFYRLNEIRQERESSPEEATVSETEGTEKSSNANSKRTGKKKLDKIAKTFDHSNLAGDDPLIQEKKEVRNITIQKTQKNTI